ncbi:MAG: very short patch repair endonuclease [Fibrobacteraceae bacterium]
MSVAVSEARSRNMRAVHSKNTGPELLLRKELFALGFRYRLYVKSLPGTPDMVFPRYHAAVFVNGCFWHRHGCRLASRPKKNEDFWKNKFDNNVVRDIRTRKALSLLGWRVATVWECSLGKKRADGVAEILADFLRGDSGEIEI